MNKELKLKILLTPGRDAILDGETRARVRHLEIYHRPAFERETALLLEAHAGQIESVEAKIEKDARLAAADRWTDTGNATLRKLERRTSKEVLAALKDAVGALSEAVDAENIDESEDAAAQVQTAIEVAERSDQTVVGSAARKASVEQEPTVEPEASVEQDGASVDQSEPEAGVEDDEPLVEEEGHGVDDAPAPSAGEADDEVKPEPVSNDGAIVIVRTIAAHMHPGHHWRKTPKGPRMFKEPLRDGQLVAHATGGTPIGLCPITPGTSTTHAALFDLDDHEKKIPLGEMFELAQSIASAGIARGLMPNVFTSSGGRGVHILYLWDDPQDAHSVRGLMREVLDDRGFRDGTGGVDLGRVEVFPKQDSVADGYGSMWVLPLAGRSVPLFWSREKDYRLAPIDPCGVKLRVSASVPVRAKPERPERESDAAPIELLELKAALGYVDPNALDYDEWWRIIAAIHSGTGGSEEGFTLALEWSARNSEKYAKDPEHLENTVWPYLRERQGGITAATIFKLARENGYGAGTADDFEPVPELTPEEEAEQAAMRARNAAKLSTVEGRQRDVEAIERAKPVEFVEFGDLTVEPPPRDWIIEDWLAAGVVVGLFSRGGYGKSLLAQQLATAVAAGTTWLGMPVVKGGGVIGIHAEEDPEELRRRQYRIAASADMRHAPEGLMLSARLGELNLLMSFDDRRLGRTTRLFTEIDRLLAEHKPRLLILDNAAQLAALAENDRAMVTQFVNTLAGLARRHGCAVLLLGHTAKVDGSTFSGSSAWENVARTRWFLDRKDDGTSELSIEKSNIGSTAKLALVFENGVLRRFDRGTEVTAKTEAVRNFVIGGVRELTRLGRHTTHAANQPNYLPKVLVAHKVDGGYEPRALKEAMGNLIALGVLKTGVRLGWTENRNPIHGLQLDEAEAAKLAGLDGAGADDLV